MSSSGMSMQRQPRPSRWILLGRLQERRQQVRLRSPRLPLTVFAAMLLLGAPAFAQEQHQDMPGMKMPGMKMSMPMQHDAVSELLMRQASGTSMNPQSAPMAMSMTQHGDWMVMLHGLAFINDVQQSGP